MRPLNKCATSKFFGKRISLFRNLFLLLAFAGLFYSSFGQTTYTWRSTATSSSWTSSANWSPTGVPGAGDNVVIVASSHTPVYNGTVLNNFTLTSGAIDLGGNTLVINGTAIFTSGTVFNGKIQSQGTSTVFTNGTFNCKVTSTTNDVSINGGTFNDSTIIVKNGTSDQHMNGNATFNSYLSLSTANASTGFIRIQGGVTFNGTTLINNNSSKEITLDNNTANNYQGDIVINNTHSGSIRIVFTGNVTFGGNIQVNSSGTGIISFCEQSGSSASLASGKTISIGSGGFTSGTLRLRRFTQLGSTTPQNLVLNGGTLDIDVSNTFNSDVTVNYNGSGTVRIGNSNTFHRNVNVSMTGTGLLDIGASAFNSKNYFSVGNMSYNVSIR